MYTYLQLLIFAYTIKEVLRRSDDKELRHKLVSVADSIIGDTVTDEHEYADNLVMDAMFGTLKYLERAENVQTLKIYNISDMTQEEFNNLLDSFLHQ